MPVNPDQHRKSPGDPPLRLVGARDTSGSPQGPDGRGRDRTVPADSADRCETDRVAQSTPTNGATDRLVHELANLLDGSRRQVELALRQLHDDDAIDEPQLAKHLTTATEAMDRMADMMTAHRRGHSVLPPAGFNPDTPLHRVIDHAVRLIQPVATEQRITIEVALTDRAAGLPLGALYPVIANALRNAVEAIGSDGTITLGAAVETDEHNQPGLVMGIEDDGPGINPALPRDASGLVASGVTTRDTGSGLGLAISRDRVRMLGGDLTLEDRLPHGARVVIRLPLDESHTHTNNSPRG